MSEDGAPEAKGTDGAAEDDPTQGLIDFYSSQAALVLEQYNNINQLLGQTNDWTWPGTHCEVLLRSFLRRYMPSCYSVDKGFIFGRREYESSTKHCPEIDILIHDVLNFSPIFQVDDFVIVQAKAVSGIIQVKRTMDIATLRRSMKNVVEGKEHFLRFCSPKSYLSVFSAAVFFDERINSEKEEEKICLWDRLPPYQSVLSEFFGHQERWRLAPDFIGSLKGVSLYRDQYGEDLIQYIGVPSRLHGKNLCLQLMLWKASRLISPVGCSMPFAFPTVPRSEIAKLSIDKAGKCSCGPIDGDPPGS
jgi:hypothetical protein